MAKSLADHNWELCLKWLDNTRGNKMAVKIISKKHQWEIDVPLYLENKLYDRKNDGRWWRITSDENRGKKIDTKWWTIMNTSNSPAENVVTWNNEVQGGIPDGIYTFTLGKFNNGVDPNIKLNGEERAEVNSWGQINNWKESDNNSRIDFANAAMAKDLGIDFNMPNKFEYDGISIDVVDEYSIKSWKWDEIIYFSDPETEDIQKDIATLIAISKCLKGANKVEIKDENTLTVTKQGWQQEFNIKNMGLVDNGGTLLNKIEDVCSWMNNYIKKHPDTINEPGNVTTQNSVWETNPNTRDDQVYESTSYSWKQPKRDSDA